MKIAMARSMITALLFLVGAAAAPSVSAGNRGDGGAGAKGQAGPKAQYQLVIEDLVVLSRKADGKAWDAFGNAPDPQILAENLDTRTKFTTVKAPNTFRTTYNVIALTVTAGQTIELDVWDVDLQFHDHIGLKRLSLTDDILEKGGIDLAFGQIASLRLKFQKIIPPPNKGVQLQGQSLPRLDDRDEVDTIFRQVAPAVAGGQVKRSEGHERAVLLIQGLRPCFFERDRACVAEFECWQEPESLLCQKLSGRADVYAFCYGQTCAVDKVSAAPALAKAVAALKDAGYCDIVLVGHSAGGVVARHFVEDNPRAGVTKVIQVCSPNAGAALAHLKVLASAQRPFIDSLTPQARMKAAARREGKVPDHVQFACIVSTFGKFGDTAVSAYSQWPKDLREQKVPAYLVAVDHTTAMRTKEILEEVCRLVTADVPRWDDDMVNELAAKLGK